MADTPKGSKMTEYHSTIRIEVDDTSKIMRVTWPDGWVHTYHLTPEQTAHTIKNRIADEINRITVVPELCSGAGGLQYERRMGEMLQTFKYYLVYESDYWRVMNRFGNQILVKETIQEIIDFFKKSKEL